MRDTSTLEISLPAIDENMATLRRLVGPACRLCPIVKADAYGLGAPQIARRLAQAGADMLAVYSPEQAAAALRAAPGVPVLVLMPVRDIRRTDELSRALVAGQLHLALHDEAHLATLVALGERFGTVIPIHLEVDSGLGRGGAHPDEALQLLSSIAATRWVRLAGVMTHFAGVRTDEAGTRRQLAAFNRVLRAIWPETDANGALGDGLDALPERVPDGVVVHVASTYALLRDASYHQRMVRFGLAWAGYGIDELAPHERMPGAEALVPALTWASQIVQLKCLPAGGFVGYGSLWRAKRQTLLGLVPVGYADGYPRSAGAAQVGIVLPQTLPHLPPTNPADGDGAARLERRFVPVVGAVNMDQISIDLTDLLLEPPAAGSALAAMRLPPGLDLGTRVELISPDRSAPNHLPRVAAAAGTIPHELLARLHPGIRRVHRCEPLVENASERRIPLIAAVG